MKTREALTKVFTQPRSLFISLKGEHKWVPAVVFMVALLAIHGITMTIGKQSRTEVDRSIDLHSPVTFSQLDSSQGEVAAEDSKSEKLDLVHSDNVKTLDINDRPVGSFILWLSFAIASLPLAFGVLCLVSLIEAVYFRIVSALLNHTITIGDWFVLSVWSRVPGITLSVVALVVGLLLLGRQPESDELEILRLTKWVDLPEVNYTGENWGIGANFDHWEVHLIWIIALQAIGFSAWTGRGFAFSLGIALIPTLILVALTAGAILMF